MIRRLARRTVSLLRPARRAGCTKDTVRCDFWNWGPDTVRPPCCTAHLTDLTIFSHELLARHGIAHWIDYGTLLGAVRGGTLIPWDEDVDFGVLEEDVPRILALEDEVAEAGYVLDSAGDPSVVRVRYSDLNEQHVDLIRWADEDGELHSSMGTNYDWPGLRRRSFSRRFIEHPEPVELYGRAFPAPAPVHEFLVDHRYGSDYMVPTRAAISMWLYPELTPEEMSPGVKHLLESVALHDRRLAELSHRGRLSRARAWEAWIHAGRPLAPSSRHIAAASAAVQTGRRSEKVEQLVYAQAALEHAIDELEHPRPGDAARRMARRAVRARQALRARLAGTRRPAFGERPQPRAPGRSDRASA